MRLLLKVQSSDDFGRKLQNKMVIFICEEKAYLPKDNGASVVMTEIPKLDSDQEETDTRVALYCFYAADEKYNYVRVRSADSDIFFILLYYASKLNITLLLDTGSRRKRKLLNISQLAPDFTPLSCGALLGLHLFSRCDTTSAFKGIGKMKPIKLLQKKSRYQAVFQNLKMSWDVSEDLFIQLEEFTCSMSKPRSSHLNVDDLRYEMVLKKCYGKENQLNPKKSIEWSSRPTPRACLREHIKRVN